MCLGFCLVRDVSSGVPLTWQDMDLCESRQGPVLPGVYLRSDGRAGLRLAAEHLMVVAGDPDSDRPTSAMDVVDFCLTRLVPAGRYLEWRDVDLCE